MVNYPRLSSRNRRKKQMPRSNPISKEPEHQKKPKDSYKEDIRNKQKKETVEVP